MTNIRDMEERREVDNLELWQEQKRRHDPHYDGHGLAPQPLEDVEILPALTHEEFLAMEAEYDERLNRREK
jgi:hypothetical protein